MSHDQPKPFTYHDISLTEANQLYPPTCRIHDFYALLLKRMGQRGFDRFDPYYVRVENALDCLHTVKIWTFYATVKCGVGAPERKD